MTGRDIFKEVGRRWQSLTAEEKLVYKERAKTDTARLADSQKKSDDTTSAYTDGEL